MLLIVGIPTSVGRPSSAWVAPFLRQGPKLCECKNQAEQPNTASERAQTHSLTFACERDMPAAPVTRKCELPLIPFFPSHLCQGIHHSNRSETRT